MSWCKYLFSFLVSSAFLFAITPQYSFAQPKDDPKDAPKVTLEELAKKLEDAQKAADAAQTAASDGLVKSDSAWMLVSTALVMLMVPGLALFYGGMVRRKNVLGTMMHSMVALSIVGVFWIAIGYSLAFGDPWLKTTKVESKEVDGKPTQVEQVRSFVGYSPELVFLRGVSPSMTLPNSNIPVYLHMLFQGMFAIITPALISGALAERIRFLPYTIFIVLWVALIYCPLAHMVWGFDFNWKVTANVPKVLAKDGPKKEAEEKAQAEYKEKHKQELADAGKTGIGYLGTWPSIDFAGGTVVHIAAGFSSLAALLLLRRRHGYPEQAFHPNSMVLTLIGAGFLWFGWFGFNGGSATASGALATSAFGATQAAAAAAGLSWMIVEWIHRGKPTALGLASGIVAGLVAVTPASGYIFLWGGLAIGLISGFVCYLSVFIKSILKYDDTLDAFGVHGVGGFLGAVLTGVFCSAEVNSAADGITVWAQFITAAISAGIAFFGTVVLVKVIDIAMGFTVSEADETVGLDRIEHGEVGFDFGLADESPALDPTAPRAAVRPPNGVHRFHVVVEGANTADIMKVWNELCQPSTKVPAEFKAIYPNVTTVQGNRFQFRGGDQASMKGSLERLFRDRLKTQVTAKLEA